MRITCLISASARRAALLLLISGTLLCAGCAGRFSTETEYLAPGFTRESLRGRTVAVIPPATPAGMAGLYEDELAGIAQGMREAGARVVIAVPAAGAAATGGATAASPQFLRDGGSPAAPAEAAHVFALPQAVLSDVTPTDHATYRMNVDFTDATVYRAYAAPRDRGGDGRASAASRTSGRRVGLRFTLVRASDGEARWVAAGSGELWRTRTATAPGAAPAALTVDDDLASGNLPLYPPPPPAETVSRRLVRRLLALVPSPPPLQPS